MAINVVKNGGTDTISGGGNDTIFGDFFGNDWGDWLTGGAGADEFRYNSLGVGFAAGRDTITDFEHAIDKIDVAAIDAIAGGLDGRLRLHRRGKSAPCRRAPIRSSSSIPPARTAPR